MDKNNPVYINKNVIHRRDKKWMDKNTSKRIQNKLNSESTKLY